MILKYTDFFNFKPITDCLINCTYGDTCGANFTGDATNVVVTKTIDPWEITASNNNIGGY